MTDWMTVDGRGWEVAYTGDRPTDTDIRTAIAEAILNGRTGIGYTSVVTINGNTIEATSLAPAVTR